MWNSKHTKIRKKIEKLEHGSVFVLSDFSDIADAATVSKVMTRLEEEGVVKRILRGVFCKTNDENMLPSPDAVARALARSNTWRVVPCGETALHIAGLMEDVPGTWTYITDAAYRTYEYDDKVIEFRHANGKLMNFMSDKTAMIVQVIKQYGKNRITDDIMKKLKSIVSKDEVEKILAESKNTVSWIYGEISKMFRKKTGDEA